MTSDNAHDRPPPGLGTHTESPDEVDPNPSGAEDEQEPAGQ